MNSVKGLKQKMLQNNTFYMQPENVKSYTED